MARVDTCSVTLVCVIISAMDPCASKIGNVESWKAKKHVGLVFHRGYVALHIINLPAFCIDLIFNLLGDDVDNKYKVIPEQLCMLYYMRDTDFDSDERALSPFPRRVQVSQGLHTREV